MAVIRGFSKATTIRKSSPDYPDLEHLAVIAGLPGNTELTTAVQSRHDGHHRHNLFAAGVVERGFHVWLLAEPDQVARGRKRQLEPPALAAGERLARRQPDRIGGFPAVMGAHLLGRRRGEEEPGVEPLR